MRRGVNGFILHEGAEQLSRATWAGNVTTLITLAPRCSAALAAGRLASRWTILLNKSALSHGERLGGALCLLPAPPRSLSLPFPWMCPPLLSSAPPVLFCSQLSFSSDLFIHLPVGLAEKSLDLLCHHLLPVVPGKYRGCR